MNNEHKIVRDSPGEKGGRIFTRAVDKIKGLKMNYIGRVLNNCKYIYNEINAATLTGAIDVVVVEQPDGTYTCSPFHVRFGKLGVLRSKEKIVDIEINGEPVDIHMKLGESGEAFFVQEVEHGEDDDDEPIPPHLATSPIPPNRFIDGPDRWGDEDEVIDVDAQAAVAGVQLETDKSNSVALTALTDAPKTFKAETVVQSEIDSSSGVVVVMTGRQLSHEFRPIASTSQPSDDASLSSHESSDFVKEDSPMSVDDRNGVNNTNGKRKRRKKSGKKKKNSTASLSGGMLSTEGEIFQIDEDIKPEKETDDKLILEQKPPELTQSVERDIHFFSDTEITPGSRFESTGENELGPGYRLLKGPEIIKAFPRDGHEFAPVQSDTEFETSKRTTESESAQNAKSEEQAQSWRWGELPTSSPSEENKQESQKWMIQNMLGFMKKTKHMRHKNEADGGIYLSELNSDDPEMAALYFPSAYRQTSGTNQDLTGEEIREEDAESGNGPSLPQSPHSVEGAVCGPKSLLDSDFDKWYNEDIAMSLCGLNASAEQFNECLVAHEHFCNDPTMILGNPKLVVRIDGKLYSWRLAAPLLLSIAAFRKPLPEMTVARLEGEAEGEIEVKEAGSKQPIGSKKAYSSWFTWSRNNTAGPPLEPESISGVKIESVIKAEVSGVPTEDHLLEVITDQVQELPLDLTVNQAMMDKSNDLTDPGTPDFNSDKYRKTLRLTSEQIASLKLQPGANEVQFSVTTAYQGTTRCKCLLFCWRYDDKIVVSDIDGTITKSDVLGHILPIVGKDWAQSGVAKLFTKIKDNGYKLLYLSARAIGQSRVTRDYLKSIKQEDLTLPEGPMLLNPTSLLNAFHTEVIEKKPEEFKISCLKDIQALFPTHIKPFYAGYGNKINDVWAYQAVGIPIFRIFTINHRGELKHELTETFQSTYTNMSQLVDQMFPANNRYSSEDFSQFVYWREPIVDVSLELSSQY